MRKFGIGLISLALTLMPLHGVLADTPPVNLIANPSMETATGSTPTGWTSETWGTNTTVFSYENTGHTGTHSVKTTVSAYTNGDSKWAHAPVNVTPGQQYKYSNYYKSNVGTELDVEVTTATGISYDYVATATASPDTWAQISGEFTAPAGAVSVRFMQIISSVATNGGPGYLQIDDASLATYTPSALTRGIVSLTFDDGWLDQYTNGRPILNAAGLKSTYYLLTGTVTDPEYMTTADMAALGTDGNELASHTVHHCNLAQNGTNTDDPTNCPVPLPLTQVDSELQDSQTQLRAWFSATNTGVADDFATPYGAYDGQSLTEIKKFYKSHRSTDEGFNSKDNFDVYNIKVQNILDATTPAQVQAWVDQAIATKTWLVLVYHRVGATDTAAEDYGVTKANLTTEAAYIKSKVDAGQIANLTVAQAIAEVQAQTGTTPPATKPGDVNGDNVIDSLDLSLVLSNWNKTGATKAQGDLNADGIIDSLDLSLVLANWSK